MTFKDSFAVIVRDALDACYESGTLSSGLRPTITIEKPARPEHGDFATTVAMQLAKAEGKNPRAIAELIKAEIPAILFEKIETAGPGFINFTLKKSAWHEALIDIIDAGEYYGKSGSGAGEKLQVEFVSANPTGPLHIGHGRGAVIGDTLCRLFEATGWDVTREFYYNDAGQQITNLARSVQARCLGIQPTDSEWPADGYQGDYIVEVAAAYIAGNTVNGCTAAKDPDDLDAIRQFAVAYLRGEQDLDLQALGVGFDTYFLESSLYADGLVDATVEKLVQSGYTYELDGALWLKTTDFGDDKDRVMRKKDGGYTYFVPDVAYHLNKWQRGFVRVVNEQGADHHSTVTRVRAGLQALGADIPSGWPEYVLHQMVTVMKDGVEVKISKRAGSYVTMRELIDEVGRDAVRYFFSMRRPDTQMVFDITLAKERTAENPVFYIQYAHARICRLFETAGAFEPAAANPALLETPEEIGLIKTLCGFPEVVRGAADHCEPHRITTYLGDLAGELHGFYTRHRVLGVAPELTASRLYLLAGVRQVIANALALLGVSAPEWMPPLDGCKEEQPVYANEP